MEHMAGEMTRLQRNGESKTEARRKPRLRLAEKGRYCLLQNKNTQGEEVWGERSSTSLDSWPLRTVVLCCDCYPVK